MLYKKKLLPYLLIIPSFLFLGMTFFYPAIKLIQMSLFNSSNEFVGVKNFKVLLTDPIYLISIKNNLLMLLILVPLMVLISILIAVFLYERLGGWKIYRFILFLPYILAIPVVGIIFLYLLQDSGSVNYILRSIGLEKIALNWLSSKLAIYTIMLIILWKEIGLGIIIFLSRLMSVNEELYEAAELDGANWFQRLINITIPQLIITTEFYIIIVIITILSWVFNYVYVITRGGPVNSTYVMELYIYNYNFKYGMTEISATASVMLLVFISFIILVQLKLRGGLIRRDEKSLNL